MDISSVLVERKAISPPPFWHTFFLSRKGKQEEGKSKKRMGGRGESKQKGKARMEQKEGKSK